MNKGAKNHKNEGRKVLINITICVISFLIGLLHTASGDGAYAIAGILITGLSSFLFYSHLKDYRILVLQDCIPETENY